MVLGIGEGRIEIKTEKQSYAPGETVKGEVVLTLNATKKAHELRIMFYGEVTEHYQGRDSHGRSHSRSSTRRVYEQKIVLGGEQEYPQGAKAYPFELILSGIPSRQQSDAGVMGAISGFLGNMIDPLASAQWYIDASLDMPMSLDISKKTRINIIR